MTRFGRAFVRFQNNPSSVRYASAAIIATIAALVVAGAVLIRVFDSEDYPSFGEALWFTLQTVTTVGYGDTTPKTFVGRFVASIVMLVSIGLVTVITATITSMFIRSLGQERAEAQQDSLNAAIARIEATLASAHERIARIEHAAMGDRAAEETDQPSGPADG